ncbi:Ff.00g130120.m01.CDS01 [Fusarium sp. VM40]|nr:Ff.00g130120.m01.CDS01 [Fusarium sp. VM40]
MPKVLVIGATGYLGRQICDTLVRSGQHRVYGIARSETKSKTLAVSEIIPVLCPDPIDKPAAYMDAIRDFNIDIVIDVSGANQDSIHFLEDIKTVGQERLDKAKLAGLTHMPKLGFIYCSGTWVHGSSHKPVNDLDIVGSSASIQSIPLVAWRVKHENAVLAASQVLDVAVLRPALIYGCESTIWTPFFLPLLQACRNGSPDTLQIALSVNSRPGLVHVSDVATGFKQAVERLSLINDSSIYPVFDLVTSQESVTEIFSKLSSYWGFKGQCELVGPGDDLFAEAMGASLRGSSDRAKQLLAWEPSRLTGFVTDMDVYADAFAAQH